MLLPVDLEAETFRISPTDISQFIRLDQCERYLRLQLHVRGHGTRFMDEYNVSPQPIPPLLTRSGREFEERVEAAMAARHRTRHLAREARDAAHRQADNQAVLQEAHTLPAGGTVILFQARLQVVVDGWRLSGDADTIRLERDSEGALHALIVDTKSTAVTKVEHRLQVAFYQAMLETMFQAAGEPLAQVRTGILYRGAAEAKDDAEAAQQEAERAAAEALLGADALLELIDDPGAYLGAVRDLVLDPASRSRRVATAPFEELPFHLSHKCDGCLYNEFCMKWAAEHDDLSLIPHLTAGDKAALRRCGIRTTSELARLKELESAPGESQPALVPAPGREDLCRRVARTWPVGPRLDELIHRARRYRKWKRDPIEAANVIPSKGYGSLPYCDATQNPNLVRVYIDAQQDHLHERLYLLSARVVACEAGAPARSRNLVHLAEGPPATAEIEADLLLRWIEETLRTVHDLATPDAEGKLRAPLHLIFYNSLEQKYLLDALSRHFPTVLGAAPALYEFMTQLAAFDSPIATFLDEEIRELKNYPMVCQSLQAVAARLKFKWDEPEAYTRHFRDRLFDYWGKLNADGEPEWYGARARFNSQIPLEFAYAAWQALDAPAGKGKDDFAAFRQTTPDLLMRFQARRLEALERIAQDFKGNALTQKRAFDLPELAAFSDKARSLAQALDEFLTIERHVELNAWKLARHAPPERRVLAGETLLVRYLEEDQTPDVAERNRENERRRLLYEQFRQEFLAANPGAKQVKLPPEQKEACKWDVDKLRVRLRLETEGVECDLEHALALCTLKPGERMVVCPRWTVDERLPAEGQTPFMPTPKQMLWGTRASLVGIELERDDHGRIAKGWVVVEFVRGMGGASPRGYYFGSIDRPLVEGSVYSLDADPNNFYGSWCAKVTEGLIGLETGKEKGRNTLYERISRYPGPAPEWSEAAATGQRRFLDGLDAFRSVGLHGFEESKRDYIGRHGDAGILLVQGPPGTGKSYSTAFALFARLQGALAAGQPFRAMLSCKTHAATDVLLANVRNVQVQLAGMREAHPELFDQYFDPRLLTVPLYRLLGREVPPPGVEALAKDDTKAKGEPKNLDVIRGETHCVVGATPGAIYGLVKNGKLFGTPLCDCLILDEASQMNLPEAVMAALLLRPEGQLIVVGDHRQMPPIVQHDWETEPRRTFREYRAYESLFLTLLPLEPPTIRFAESFRLHADMAEFLRAEIYRQDGIEYFSRKHGLLPAQALDDPFLAAVLDPAHPLVVIVHEEAQSQTNNPFEEALIAPVLRTLADAERYNLDPMHGLGVVVPHRAQRAALQLNLPCLSVVDPETGVVLRSAVDTVERFQGDERKVILISATESDPEYLLASSKFLLDPRRLTVAMSRAKQKLVLVASRSVFSVFSPDEETFANSQLWKNLLRHTCTTELWRGVYEGRGVVVWGNGKEAAGAAE